MSETSKNRRPVHKVRHGSVVASIWADIRRRILLAFETAERATDPEQVRQWLTFLVIGAGPTGVELAGALAEIARHTLQDEFRNINPSLAQIFILEGSDRVLQAYPPALSAKAKAALEQLGVIVRTKATVTEVWPKGVAFRSGEQTETVQSGTMLWAAGVKASPLGKVLAEAAGIETDCQGRVPVESDLSVQSHPEVFVVGDLAHVSHPSDSPPLPGLAPVAQLAPIVFLLDVDNTLLDNDRIIADLNQHLTQAFGIERQHRYWKIFEQRREEVGYADYLGALQRYRAENPHDPQFLQVSFFLLEYPFVDRLYPASLDVIEHLNTWGPTVILSDGDVVFQPRKAERSGLYKAVEGRTLIYIHKEQELDDVEIRYPARHYVLVDDKLRILTAVKKVWGTRVTTVFPRQGHYAHDPKALAAYPPADIAIDRIGDLLRYDLPALLPVCQAESTRTASELTGREKS